MLNIYLGEMKEAISIRQLILIIDTKMNGSQIPCL